MKKLLVICGVWVPLFFLFQNGFSDAVSDTLSVTQWKSGGHASQMDFERRVILAKDVQKKGASFNHADAPQLRGPFDSGPAVTRACVSCHSREAQEFIKTVHWTWRGPSPNMVGYENATNNGKVNGVNNFCISIVSNWGRCTQCHAGYGWKDESFDFSQVENIDCLVCHERTGTYKKNPKTAGNPNKGIDLTKAAWSVGEPTRANCGSCHFFAGGGDNVKKGDLGSALAEPARDTDVHMGGLDFSCQKCHTTEKHAIRGSSMHNMVYAGNVSCTDCHSPEVHDNKVLTKHTESVACQTCHIPAFSRAQATKMFWDWSKAGKRNADGSDIVKKDADGNPVYHSKKGAFRWEKNVRPTYAWWNSKFTRKVIGDTYEKVPVDLGSPVGSINDPASKIYPFKVMRGIQAADPVTKQMIVPHLFGKAGGSNPYWAKWDWEKSFEEGMQTAGLEYSGTYEWVETYMYLVINHEVAPKSEALTCTDCHSGGIDFTKLGYSGDPMTTGGRFSK